MQRIACILLSGTIAITAVARAESDAPADRISQPAHVEKVHAIDTTTREGSLLVSALGTNWEATTADQSNCRPQWDLQAESIFLWRDNDARSRPITALNPQSIDFDAGIGPMITLGLRADAKHGWEGRYFSALGMTGEIDNSNSNFAQQLLFTQLDFSAPGFNGPDSYALQYQSDLHSAEINYVHSWDRLSLLGGFRFVRLSENFEWRSGRSGISSEVAGGSLGTHTNNDLYGGQIGARWRQNYQRLFCDIKGRAGLFGNEANQRTTLLAIGYLDPREFAGSTTYDSAVAFVGDLNFSAGIRVTSVWAIRAGYNLIWIDRVALAPDQFQGFEFASQQVAIDGSVFLHGVNVGLEGCW
jgi:hypothetical protein